MWIVLYIKCPYLKYYNMTLNKGTATLLRQKMLAYTPMSKETFLSEENPAVGAVVWTEGY